MILFRLFAMLLMLGMVNSGFGQDHKKKGWKMETEKKGKQWAIICTTDKKQEVEKIRALGYIGLLAEGAHHKRHHWMIATGKMGME